MKNHQQQQQPNSPKAKTRRARKERTRRALRLLDLLRGQGVREEKVAVEAQVSIWTVWRWRSGASTPSRNNMTALEKVAAQHGAT